MNATLQNNGSKASGAMICHHPQDAESRGHKRPPTQCRASRHCCLMTREEVIAISDHAPVTLTLKTSPSLSGTTQWRFPAYLQGNLEFKTFLKRAWMDYIGNNALHTSQPTLYWEAGKTYIRGQIISYSAAYKKKKRKR